MLKRPSRIGSQLGLTLALAIAAAQGQESGPVIGAVSPIAPEAVQTITISGRGFGTLPAYEGMDVAYIQLRDESAGWTAGRLTPGSHDAVTLSVARWTDNEIVVTGFSGAYGGPWQLNEGDRVEVDVWNPQSGSGPTTFVRTVGAAANGSPATHILVSRFGPERGHEREYFLGRPAPPFSLSDLDGHERRLTDYKGKVVMLDFWATWCGPCRMEVPHLSKLKRDFDAKDVVILGIDEGEREETVRTFVQKNDLSYPVLLAPPRSAVTAQYAAHGLPTVVIVDKDGVIADYDVGFGNDTERSLRSELKHVLGAKYVAPRNSMAPDRQVAAANPAIRAVTPVTPERTQTITITGSGFGSFSPYENSDVPYLAIRDKTAGWAAGRATPENFDAVTLGVAQWIDNRIIVTGFDGAYGKPAGQWQLRDGDQVEVAVWNAQSGAGPALYELTVGGAGGSQTHASLPALRLAEPRVSGLDVSIGGITLPSAPDATIKSITWSFGDGTPPLKCSFPCRHTFANPGTFVVTVTSADSNGSTASATTNVTVGPDADPREVKP